MPVPLRHASMLRRENLKNLAAFLAIGSGEYSTREIVPESAGL